VTERERQAQAQVQRATRGMPSPKIKDVGVIATEPAGVRLSVVKITTDQDGLYGYGCATFTQRADLVNAAVERYLKPFLVGKPTDRIEDTWQACYNSSYWRNGPVLNNAISGVDEALWDIKGRQAGLPVYELLGGKCREAADCYVHITGDDYAEVVEAGRRAMAQGFRNVWLQATVPGFAGFRGATTGNAIAGLHEGHVFDPAAYAKRSLQYL
jgi:mannonate dehydratase